MGTLYDLLGALPGDDAEGLRAAFRRAAKATHPDMNPEDPEAPRRFRELMRAYDILTDADQRSTYDELLSIALQPPAAEKSTRVYERVRKYASNTMAATIISGVLVAGYTLFGHFSNPPGAAEFLPNNDRGPVGTNRPCRGIRSRRRTGATRSGDGCGGRQCDDRHAPRLSRGSAPASRSVEAAHRFTLDNLWTRRDPILAVAYLDRDIILYRAPKFDRTFDSMAQVKPAGRCRPAEDFRAGDAQGVDGEDPGSQGAGSRSRCRRDARR